MKEKSLIARKKDKAEEMYKLLNDLRRAYYSPEGIDAISKVVDEAQALIRRIDNPIIDKLNP